MLLNLGPGNCIVVAAGRCFNPLTKPSIFATFLLLFNGKTSLVISLEGENDRRNLDAADLFGELLLKHTIPSLFLLFVDAAANLEGDNGRLDFNAAPHLFGELNLIGVPFILP